MQENTIPMLVFAIPTIVLTLVFYSEDGFKKNKMEVEELKKVIFHIIGENKFLMAAVDSVVDSGNKVKICIVHNRSCGASDIYASIEIGIPDIVDYYVLSKELYGDQQSDVKFEIETKYWDFGNKDNIRSKVAINTPVQSLSDVLNGFFLNSTPLSVLDIITIYALTFSVSHELGHIVHNRYIPKTEPIVRERTADFFAFEALKSICTNNNALNGLRLKGYIVAMAQMILYNSPEKDNNDKKHPNSVERLYHLLDFWNIQDDSCYWEVAYNVVYKWNQKYGLLVSSWEKETSTSYKDKFIDAYRYFRKSPQTK